MPHTYLITECLNTNNPLGDSCPLNRVIETRDEFVLPSKLKTNLFQDVAYLGMNDIEHVECNYLSWIKVKKI